LSSAHLAVSKPDTVLPLRAPAVPGIRRTVSEKRAYTDGLLAVIDDIAARLDPDDQPSARVEALGVFAMMAGTLQLARALADRQLADEVLDQGLQNALALLGRRS
jgi:TetR/AcrR family transcriptional regulator, transcriptional repressor for nem operon